MDSNTKYLSCHTDDEMFFVNFRNNNLIHKSKCFFRLKCFRSRYVYMEITEVDDKLLRLKHVL